MDSLIILFPVNYALIIKYLFSKKLRSAISAFQFNQFFSKMSEFLFNFLPFYSYMPITFFHFHRNISVP